MPGLIGKKIGMTSVFGADGKNIPCTVIEAGPCVVTQVRTVEKDGYAAVQLAYDEITEKHVGAPLKGHFVKAGTTPKRKLAEFAADFEGELKLGDTLSVADVFKVAEYIDVVGTSKGKGFQGVVKRHGFAGVGGKLMVSTTDCVTQVLWVHHLGLHVYSQECVWQVTWVMKE